MEANKKEVYSLIPLLIIIILAPISMRYFSEEDYKNLLHPDLFQPSGINSNISTYFKSLIITYVSPIAFLSALIYGKRKINIYSILLILLFVSFTISTFSSEFRSIALFGSPHMFEGYFVFVGYLIIAFSAYSLIDSKKTFIISIIGLGLPILFMFYFGVPELFGKLIINDPFFKNLIFGDKLPKANVSLGMTNKIAATLHNPNFLGHFTSLVVLFYALLFLFVKNKPLKIFSLIVFAATCFLTLGASSRSSFIGLAIGGIISVFYLRDKLLQVWKDALLLTGIFVLSVIIINNKTDGYLLSFLTKSTEQETERQIAIQKRNIFEITPIDSTVKISTNGKTIILLNENNNFKIKSLTGEELKVKPEIIEDNNTKYLHMLLTDEQYSDFVFKVTKFKDKVSFNIKTSEKDYYPLYFTEGGFKTIFNSKIYPIINSPYSKLFEGREGFASYRGFIWKYSIPLIDQKPFFGHGAGSFPIIFPNDDRLAKHNFERSPGVGFSFVHSLYLQILLEFGWIGFSLFSLLILVYLIHSAPLYWRFNPNIASYYIGLASLVSIIAFLISGIFNNSFVGTTPFFFMILGIGIACNYKISEKKEKNTMMASVETATPPVASKKSFAPNAKNLSKGRKK